MRRCCFSQAWVQWTQAMVVVCAGLTAAAARTTGADLAAADLKSPVRFWEPSFAVSAGSGYRDNVALSHAAPEASGFFRSSLEAAATRLPLDGTQVSLILSVEDTRYFSAKSVDHEDIVFGQAEARRFLGHHWEAALGLEGSFIDQVIDLSVTETNRTAVRVRGELLLARPGVRWQAPAGFWAALDFPAGRQYYEGTLDDYWLFGPKFTLGRGYGNHSEVACSYQFTHTAYDTELARTARGGTITNLTRATGQHEAALAWKHHWDKPQHWRSTTKLGFRVNADNASGYFDYRRAQVSEQLRFRTARWLVSAEMRFSFYDFPVQTVGGPETAKRHRTDLAYNLRGEGQLARHVRLYAQFDREQALSNLTLDEYAVNTFSGGVMLEF